MVFKSDLDAGETKDAERGWELLRSQKEVPRRYDFQLRRMDGAAISFCGENVSATEVEPAHGRRQWRKGWRVYSVNSSGSSLSISEIRALIHDALVGFGVSFDGPSGPVEIEFLGLE